MAEAVPFSPFFVVGITSRVLPLRRHHWLLLDCDYDISNFSHVIKFLFRNMRFDIKTPMVWYKSPNGFHIIVFKAYNKNTLLRFYKKCRWVDPTWVDIGKERGYWFLRSYVNLLNYPVVRQFADKIEFMSIDDWRLKVAAYDSEGIRQIV
jgi:hypothetical protein